MLIIILQQQSLFFNLVVAVLQLTGMYPDTYQWAFSSGYGQPFIYLFFATYWHTSLSISSIILFSIRLSLAASVVFDELAFLSDLKVISSPHLQSLGTVNYPPIVVDVF